MRILFIGNYQNSYVGEQADEIHITRELEYLGNEVYRVSRDEWREYVIEGCPKGKYKVPEGIHPDIVIICKWHHFYEASFVTTARHLYECPVIYWTWDYMDYDGGWHTQMAQAADLFLTNEGGKIPMMKFDRGIQAQYFPFDCADREIVPENLDKKYDVVYLGSYVEQGTRMDILKKINEKRKIKVFGWNEEGWKKNGFDAQPPVFGQEFAKVVSQARIVLGVNAFDDCWGYWSNRVGKVLALGGMLLQSYVPGMELFVRNGAFYFHTPEEALYLIEVLLLNDSLRETIQRNAAIIGKSHFTSRARIGQLQPILAREVLTFTSKEQE